MDAAADVLFHSGNIFALTSDAPGPAPDASAIAISNGRILATGTRSSLSIYERPETRVIDLDGMVVLPGFIDAHTHMVHEGLKQVHADLADVPTRDAALETLKTHAATTDASDSEWIIGLGYDESTWPSQQPPGRADLDRIATDRPVAMLRVDMHTAVLNSYALNEFGPAIDPDLMRYNDGEATGIVLEDAISVISPVVNPSIPETRRVLDHAIRLANQRGITGVHDKVRNSHAPRVYRDLDRDGSLSLRVRIDYWMDHLESLQAVGVGTNHGTEMVRVGAIKSFSDGSIGARTAKLQQAYHDGGSHGDTRGEWVVRPSVLNDRATGAAKDDFQLAIHAIGDEAIDEVIDILAALPCRRHRIEHVELASQEAMERMAAHELVASMQPNFHQWAQSGGLYEQALGTTRTAKTNRFRELHDRGVTLAFGSDCMPMDPLFGIHCAVNAPTAAQSLSVGEAIAAYTSGAAFAGFDDRRVGSLRPGYCADLVVLADSPWEQPTAIREIDVAMTVVDGTIVYEQCA